MADIVLAAGTSHSVLLACPPSMWAERADQDRRNPNLYDNSGVHRTYDELAAAAGDAYLDQIGPEAWEARWKSCQAALDRLRGDFRDARPDVLLVIGDDQRELFDETNQPAIAVACADVMRTGLIDDHDSELYKEVAKNYLMDTEFEFRGDPSLASDLVTGLVGRGFDVTWMASTPHGRGFGHAYGFPMRRFFLPDPLPRVIPLMLNTYFPPNQPTPQRCYELGQAVRGAIEASSSTARVAVLASGGLSHFVVNEALDRQTLDAISSGDAQALQTLPVHLLNSGASEIRNWITVAGIMAGYGIRWSEYVPIYRSSAGTGCAMGFLTWDLSCAKAPGGVNPAPLPLPARD